MNSIPHAADANVLLRQLIHQYGHDIAAEALYQMWEQCGVVEPAYAIYVATRLSSHHYHDGLPPSGAVFELFTRDGTLDRFASSCAILEDSVLQEDIDIGQPETPRAWPTQDRRAAAQEQLKHVPRWLVEIHLAHQHLQELSQVIRERAPQARYRGVPSPPRRPRGRPRLWPVGMQLQSRRGRRRVPIYLHPYSVTPGATDRRSQPRVVPARMLTPPLVSDGPKPAYRRPWWTIQKRLYGRHGIPLIPKTERVTRWGVASKKTWVPWHEAEQ